MSEEEFERRKKNFADRETGKRMANLYRRQCTSAHRGATVYWEKRVDPLKMTWGWRYDEATANLKDVAKIAGVSVSTVSRALER